MSKTSKLTAAERARRYREKIKLDKARNDEYKRKKKESNEKRMKRGDMPKKMLQRERAKNREYVRARKLKKAAERQMTDTLSSTITQAHGLPEFISNEKEELPAIPTKFNENTSENKRVKRYNKQLKNQNRELRLLVDRLKSKLKHAEKKKQKYQKKLQRSKKHIKDTKSFSLTVRDSKETLSLLKQKYTQKKINCSVMVSKLLKRYRLKKILGNEKKKLPEPLPRKTTTINDFFMRDDVSRACAGKKETVTRGKIKKQKRYLSDTMKNLYKMFKSENSNINISYVSFTRQKPFFIKSPSVSDRNTCACMDHANIDLKASKLFLQKALVERNPAQLVKKIMCDSESALCAWGLCKTCKSKKIFIDSTNSSDECKWFQWESVTEKRLNKKSISQDKYDVKVMKKVEKVSTVANLVSEFQKDMLKFKKHYFNVRNQYSAYRFCKDNLSETEVLIHIDFSENYMCKLSEEVQSFHFGASRNQASLHTGLIYLKKIEKPVSFCTISSDLNHGPGAIWAHLDPIIDYLKDCAPEISTIHFFSDGPSSQYKQKNNFFFFCNRIFDKKFTGATWSFFEKSHGKGAADGVGAVVKRTADSIVAHGEDIVGAEELYHSLLDKIDVKLFYVSPHQICNINKTLPTNLKTIQGTRDIHQIITKSRGELIYRSLSCFCNLNLWGTGNLCNCHKLNSKVVKMNGNEKKQSRLSFHEVYTDSE